MARHRFSGARARSFALRRFLGLLLMPACVALAACGGGGSAGSATPPGAAPTPTPSPPPLTSPFDAVIQQNYAGGWGVELGVYHHGTLVYSHGYGLRDRGLPDTYPRANFWGIPQPDVVLSMPRGALSPDADTIFNLASVSKEFTAGAILLLQQDGKLSVNDRLATYFPSFPNASTITLLQLLQHSSGLVDYVNFGDSPDFTPAYQAFAAGGHTDYTPVLAELGSFPLLFPPGSAYNYSNSDYLLLGLIVAQVSGQPLGTFLRQRIFAPLGMTRTQQGYPPAPEPNFAIGYVELSGAVFRAWQWDLPYAAGAGGLTSTIGDLEKWDRGVRAPGIFTAASLAQMFTPGPFPQSYGTYADGWFISTLQGHRFIWHDGDIGGYQTVNATFPDDDIDIIVLTNDGLGIDPYFLMPQLFPIALSTAPGSSAAHRAR